MRPTFVSFLMAIAEKDPSIVFITGDLGFEFTPLKEKYPARYFNMGVCEQSMLSVAAGLALQGFKPIVYSITPFLLERPFEQLKIDINSQKAKVMLVGFADYPTLGPTHAELDWKTIGPLLKNTACFFPETKEDAERMFMEAYAYEGPSIISLKKAKSLPHFFCSGECKGVASTEGVCMSTTCSKKGQPLVRCTCVAPEHKK
jgi:transketolase